MRAQGNNWMSLNTRQKNNNKLQILYLTKIRITKVFLTKG
jgi:hypothetical protein